MLEVSNVTLHYGAAQALRGVSLKAGAGKITCVLGRNGVGKTSLMRSIVGHHRLTSGSVAFEGKALDRSAAYDRARSGIAFVPQGREIFPLLTVRENLESGFAPLKRADRNVPAHVFELFPVLKQMLGRRGGDLSGGQQQQLAIGRALVMRPRLLLLDEPTEGIQPSIIKDIGRAISYLRGLGKIAIVLVEQYLDFAQELGDQFLVMDRGQVIYSSTRGDLDEAALKRENRSIPDDVFALFPVLNGMLRRRGGDLSGGQQQQLAIGRALVMRPRLLLLDEPTEGIQPSIIKDIGRAIRYLRDQAGIAVLLVEQYLDFCRELADEVNIMDRGLIVHTGPAEDLDRPDVRKFLTV